MYNKRKWAGKFRYILASVGNKFSWRIYLQTRRRSDIRGIFQKVRINFWKRLWKMARRKKVKLLPGKFWATEHEKYVNFIMLKKPGEETFRETIQIQTKIFGEQMSLFNTLWKCLNLTKKDCEDYTTFTGTVDMSCERF